MPIESNTSYMEGRWAAQRIVPNIKSTNFKTIEGAITHKTALISKFETDFGFTREMDKLDGNYAYNLGMLDQFTKFKEEEE